MKENKKKDNEKQLSTVLSDPKQVERANRKKRSFKKKVLAIISIILVVFVLVPWIIVKVADSSNSIVNDGKPKFTFGQLLEGTKADTAATSLYELKTNDVNDLETLQNITDLLMIKENLGEFKITVSSEKRPYRVTLSFENSHDGSQDEWFELTVIKYSCVIMALVKNAEEVGWLFPSANGGVGGSYFTRGDAAKLMNLGVSIDSFGQSADAVQLILNQLGLNE